MEITLERSSLAAKLKAMKKKWSWAGTFASSISWIIVTVPLFIFYSGFSYVAIELLNMMNDGSERILSTLRTSTPVIGLILAVMVFITNACIGFARVEFSTKAQHDFKRAAILFLMATIGFAATLITLVATATLKSDDNWIVFGYLVTEWRGRLLGSICAVTSIIVFSLGCLMLVPVLVHPAREFLYNRFSARVTKPKTLN